MVCGGSGAALSPWAMLGAIGNLKDRSTAEPDLERLGFVLWAAADLEELIPVPWISV